MHDAFQGLNFRWKLSKNAVLLGKIEIFQMTIIGWDQKDEMIA